MAGFLQPTPPSTNRIKGLNPKSSTNDDVSFPADGCGALDKVTKSIKYQLENKFVNLDNLYKVEVKSVGFKLYRANVCCIKFTEGSYFPSYQRPYSYYITVAEGGELIFNPSLV